jgi:integrase
MSPDGGQRKRKSACHTLSEVRKVVSVLEGKFENLVNKGKVRDDFFRDYLDVKSKPGTSKHYIGSLVTFMDFAISEGVDLPNCSTDDYTSMKLRLCKWRNSYSKQTDEQRWLHEEDDREVLVTPEQRVRFEKGLLAAKAVQLFQEVARNERFCPGRLEYANMRDYLMTVIALANAHRSGVSANMTLSEFDRCSIDEETENALIRVRNHKTFRQHGPAVVCIPERTFLSLRSYVEHVRPAVAHSGGSQNVFLSWNGNPLESGAVSKQINSIWKRSGVYGESLPPKRNVTTTVIRKSITTLVHDQRADQAQPVADLLAHSLETAKKVYRQRD